MNTNKEVLRKHYIMEFTKVLSKVHKLIITKEFSDSKSGYYTCYEISGAGNHISITIRKENSHEVVEQFEVWCLKSLIPTFFEMEYELKFADKKLKESIETLELAEKTIKKYFKII